MKSSLLKTKLRFLGIDRVSCFAMRLVTLLLLLAFGADARVAAVNPSVRHDFDGPVQQLLVAGNGRYLIASVPTTKSIVLIDLTNPSKVLKIDTTTTQFVIAANRKELVVADTQLFRGSRYQLEDQKLLASNLTFSGEVRWIGMGACSNGPLWASSKQRGLRTSIADVSILNPETMLKAKHLEPTRADPNVPAKRNDRKMLPLTDAVVSDDGTTYVDTYRELLIQIRNKVPSIDLQDRPQGVPSFDGETLLNHFPPYPAGKIPPVTQLSKKRLIRGRCSTLFAAVDEVQDGVLVTAYDLSDFEANRGLSEALGSVRLSLSPQSPSEPHGSNAEESAQGNDPVMEFVPEYGVIARLEKDSTQLALYTISLDAHWDQSVGVSAIPKTSYCATSPGVQLEYQIPIPVGCRVDQFRLILGPDGMWVNEKGQLIWSVPKKPASQESEAFVQIVSDDGTTQPHRVLLTIGTAVAVDERGRPKDAVLPMPLKHYADMVADKPNKLAAEIDANQVIRLPSKVHRAVASLGGNHLILEMLGIESLCVFDVKSGTILGYLSNRATTFAITSNSILLLYRDPNLVEAWAIPELIQTDRVLLTNNMPGAFTLQIKKYGNVIRIRQFVPSIDVNDINVETHLGHVNLKNFINYTLYRGGKLDLPTREEIFKLNILGHVLMEGEWRAFVTALKDDAATDDMLRLNRPVPTIKFEQPISQLLSDEGIKRLIAVNSATGEQIGIISGVFDVVGPSQPSVWGLIDQGYLVQLDSTRAMLLRKPVTFPKPLTN